MPALGGAGAPVQPPTHHRGQAHAILTGLGREGPVLDLLAYQRATGIGMS